MAVTLVAWSPWFVVSFGLLLLGGIAQAGFSTMQSTILLLASLPEMRGRTVGALGLVNGLGHLVGGYEIGAIANSLGIGVAIGLNASAGLLLILPVIILTPLARQPMGARSPEAARAEAPLGPDPSQEARPNSLRNCAERGTPRKRANE